MAKLKSFLDWVGKKKGRWKVVLFSVVTLLLTIGVILFFLLSGYNSKTGFHKDPVKIDIKVNKGAK